MSPVFRAKNGEDRKVTHVRYMDRIRDYYLAQGYEKPYRWAHFEDVPFTPLKKPLPDLTNFVMRAGYISGETWINHYDP